MMQNASYPSAVLPPLASAFHLEEEKRGIIASIASALHGSRRLQASRVLRQYAHLNAHPRERITPELNQQSGGQQMPVTSRPAHAKSATQLPASSEMGWLAAVAVAFLLIHVLAGTIWMHAAADDATTSRDQAISAAYD